MLKIDTIYKSSLTSVLFIESQYDADYKTIDFNKTPSISFPIKSGYGYSSENFEGIVDTNSILFETKNKSYALLRCGTSVYLGRWTVMILTGINSLDQEVVKWQNEVNNEDIYEWEREYYSDEDFIKSRKETIEQVIKSATNKEAEVPVIVLIESDTVFKKNIASLRKLDPLTIRNIVFERELEPKPYERIIVRLVK